MSDIREHCGLFGVYGCDDAAERVYYGLYSLQHRGEESAGIASTDGKDIICYKGMGLVSDAIKPETLKSLKKSCCHWACSIFYDWFQQHWECTTLGGGLL